MKSLNLSTNSGRRCAPRVGASRQTALGRLALILALGLASGLSSQAQTTPPPAPPALAPPAVPPPSAPAPVSAALVLAQAAAVAAPAEPPEPPEPASTPEPLGAAAETLAVQIGALTGEELAFEHYGFPFSDSAASASLVVPGGQTEPPVIAEIEEDLSVMHRILTKAVKKVPGREGAPTAMGIALSGYRPGSRSAQCLHLDGFGVLFQLSVRYPLTPSAAKPEASAEKTEDSTWETTRQELYGSPRGRARLAAVVERRGSSKPVEYDGERVGSLKKGLLDALKNATHLRHLEADQAIVVVVQGTAATPGRSGASAATGGGSSASRPSVLIIRVKKQDADALAKGKLDAAEFAKRANIATY